MTKDVLESRAGKGFDAGVSLCKLSLAQVTSLPNLSGSPGIGTPILIQAENLK